MKLTVLGCLGGYPHNDQGTTSFLLQAKGYNLLIDCGSQAVTELEHHVSPLCLDSVILTHYHHDHIADLGVLQQYRQLWPKENPNWDGQILKIWGHSEDKFHFNSLTMPEVSIGKPYKKDDLKKIGPWDVTFMRTLHPVTAFALRLLERDTGKILVFTGDSGYLENFYEFAKNADVFLADTYFFAGTEHAPTHLTSKEAGEIAAKARVKKLILTHLPQHGSLEQLKKEAEEAMRKGEVLLAKPHMTVEI
ncbi:MAG: MBL fold metallo-hydrolase [Streptococcaceae bacterium]|jgi:ribonuclease BN (tRNA processing enzyme)|nr:MBL fold metallo-hydrolase [Streptococcaceae bacterium]